VWWRSTDRRHDGDVLIREAVPDDWRLIWPFFHAIVAAGDTFAYPLDLSDDQGRELWMPGPPTHTVVAVDASGAVLGTANMYANRPGNGSHVASASYMVDPRRSGRGVGRALVEYSLEWTRGAGFRAIQFNAVVETNAPAVKLWRSLGFEIVGTVPEAFRHPTHGYVGLHVMLKRL
jgi:GNAT superfamily N-acetyltransferase